MYLKMKILILFESTFFYLLTMDDMVPIINNICIYTKYVKLFIYYILYILIFLYLLLSHHFYQFIYKFIEKLNILLGFFFYLGR